MRATDNFFETERFLQDTDGKPMQNVNFIQLDSGDGQTFILSVMHIESLFPDPSFPDTKTRIFTIVSRDSFYTVPVPYKQVIAQLGLILRIIT